MPETRSGKATPNDTKELDIVSVTEEKFNKFKVALLSEIKDLIHLEVEKATKKQKEKFDSALHELQKRVVKLEHDHDDLEQYGRRLFVPLENIPAEKDESADRVFSKAENILKEACPNFSGDCIDRAHRIGRDYKSHKTNKTCRSVIVGFTSFKHRTSIYRNRNILKNVRVKLDSTKKRHNILKSARSIADGKQDVNYVFADINCRLKVVFKDGTSEFFEDISELNELIEQCMP